ncbi:MAG: DUF4348 domain-containing protein [Bacteroidales bacterium]|nr:DUF4348 domain-containing protein [Bacteroidales bacterium]
MRNAKFILLIIALFTIASYCTAQSNAPENFKKFWKSYTSDSVFQMERTKFPLPLTYYEYDEDKETEITEDIGAEFWLFDNFVDESYKSRTDKENDSYVVTKTGIENGIYVRYYFATTDGKWYLVRIIDSSN